MSEDMEARREAGHPGFQGDGHHKSATGAAIAAVKSNMSNGQGGGLGQQHNVYERETQQSVPYSGSGVVAGPQVRSTTDRLEILCGPLLNYRRMSGEHTERPVWHGSVLIVTTPGQIPDQLRLSCIGPVGSSGMPNGRSASLNRTFPCVKLYEDPRKVFWRFELELLFQEQESVWEYSIPRMFSAKVDKKNVDRPKRLAVPSKHESMRIMFHSCNGFSVGTDEEAWSGPALWNDVNRLHDQQPFHVMVGGGDQIYNDGVRVNGPLRAWTDIGNPIKRREYPFNEELRAQCDEYYFNNYMRWYNTEPFATANGQIAQLNIWDDHDIIDGFGSYTDRTYTVDYNPI